MLDRSKRAASTARAVWLFPLLLNLEACDAGEASRTTPGDEGPVVTIAAQRVESGFAGGALRRSSDVGDFLIGRHPVTVGEFRRCVAAGACQEPEPDACAALPYDGPARRLNYGDPDVADDAAVMCVGTDIARRYCEWTGGTLPTLEQWLLAARGGSPRLYPWGDAKPTCEQHGLAAPDPYKPCTEDPKEIGRVAKHPEGRAPLGIEDVLVTPGELLRPSAEALFTPCRGDGAPSIGTTATSPPACVVYGTSPGSIESVARAGSGQKSSIPYGFRCVWGGAS